MSRISTAAPEVATLDRSGLVHRLASAVGAAMVVFVLASFVASNTRLQWDLHAYRYAARAALAGLDPYQLESLSLVAVRPWGLPFVYPPAALVPFLPFASLTPAVAGALWMGLKLAFLAGLALLWRRVFLPAVEPFVLALVVVFAFDATVLSDLGAGNVAIVEAALLWSGLACWVAGRRAAFAALVVAASLFKLAPIVFLALLLVPAGGARARPGLCAAALATFVAIVWLPLAVGPAAGWEGFGHGLLEHRPQGSSNPSALALLDVTGRLAFPTLRSVDTGLALWTLYVAGVAALSVRWLRSLWRSRDARAWVMAAALLYVLLHPRPMTYGYVMAIAPALWFAPPPFTSGAGRLALAGLLAAHGLARLAHHPPAGLLLDHLSFLTVLVLWLFAVRQPGADSDANPARPPASARG